jgi:CheY-like chemotaxis protein
MPLDEAPARFDFVELGETEFAIDNVTVRTQFLNHTAPCLGYRVTVGGATFVYATDHEGHANPPWRPDRPAGSFDPAFLVHPGDASHASFLRGADVVLHDAQYSSADYPAKTGWGHSTVAYAVDIALAAQARALVLFHHDPNRDDTAVDALLAGATARAGASGQPLAVSAAAEGTEIVLEEREPSAVTASGPHAPRLPARARILVADDDIAVVKMLESVLASDGYVVDSAPEGELALVKAAVATYDLVLLDIHLPRRDGIEVCRRLRAEERYRATPVIIVTEHTRHDDMVDAFAAGVTDYIRKPFAVAQVRARVRSWLTRSATVN